MQRKFIFNLSLLVFLNLLVKPFYILGIDTEILERVGQQEYGLYFALMNLSFLMNIFLDMGIINFNTSNIAKHHQLVSKHFSAVFGIRLILSVCYLIISLCAAWILGYKMLDINILIPICINQILVGFILYFRSNLAGLQLFIKDSIISVLDRLILIIACSLILWGHIFDLEISIMLFIYLQMLAYGLTFLISFIVLSPYLSKLTFKINWAFNLVILKKSFPYAMLILLMGFYYRTDGVMLERMLDKGAYEAGIYAQAYRFFEAGNMLAYLFGALLYPMFSKLLGNKEQISELLLLAFRIITAGSIIAGIACFNYSEEIMSLRFSSEIVPASRAFQFLMIGFTGICGTYVFGALLTANENLRDLNIMALVGVFLNVILNLILIPKYKAEGAAIASMITQLGMAFAQIWLVKKKLFITPGLGLFIRILLFVVVAMLLTGIIDAINMNWVYRILLFCFASSLLSFGTGLLSIRKVVSYVSILRTYKN